MTQIFFSSWQWQESSKAASFQIQKLIFKWVWIIIICWRETDSQTLKWELAAVSSIWNFYFTKFLPEESREWFCNFLRLWYDMIMKAKEYVIILDADWKEEKKIQEGKLLVWSNIQTKFISFRKLVIPLSLYPLPTGKIRRASEILQASYLTDEDGCFFDEEVMLYSPREDQKMLKMLKELKMVCMNNFVIKKWLLCGCLHICVICECVYNSLHKLPD